LTAGFSFLAAACFSLAVLRELVSLTACLVLFQFVKWAWGLNLLMAVLAVAFIAVPIRLTNHNPLHTCSGPIPGAIITINSPLLYIWRGIIILLR